MLWRAKKYSKRSRTAKIIDEKKRFYVFIPVTFLTFFNVFFNFVNVLLFKKTFIENSIKKDRQALLKPQERINRPRLYYESGWVQTAVQSSTLGSAYSDTATVTSCIRYVVSTWSRELRQIEKVLSVSISSYTAPTAFGTALGKRLNKLGNVFYSTFLNVFNVFYFVHVFYVF